MSEDFERQFPDQYMLRLPAGMRDRLKAIAKLNARSMNAEIVSRLEASLEQTATSVGAVPTAMIEAAIEEVKMKVIEATLKAIEDGSFAKGLGSARLTKAALNQAIAGNSK